MKNSLNAQRPAAPVPFEMVKHAGEANWSRGSGLTKLEHFAGLAMQGILSNTNLTESYRKHSNLCNGSFKDSISKGSINHARALLAELGKQQ
jgi:hypothetical protein